MTPDLRRKKILDILIASDKPVSGNELSNIFDVSRQVIVQDIAVIRAAGNKVVATSQGYIISKTDDKYVSKVIASNHLKENIEDELNIIVDMGGTVLDVIVDHNVYGQILANIMVSSRKEVLEFMNRISDKNVKPLSALTNGIHLHTIRAKNEEIIQEIENKLYGKGYLLK